MFTAQEELDRLRPELRYLRVTVSRLKRANDQLKKHCNNFSVDTFEKDNEKMNYPAAELTGYPAESSSVNHSSSHQDARYSGSRMKACW